MKRIICILLLIITSITIFSFVIAVNPSPQEKVKVIFISKCQALAKQLKLLTTSIEMDRGEGQVKKHFLDARLAYKELELFIEYYFELDAPKFNGPPIDFIEEEDPTAYHEPQGFQKIESLLYPYNKNSKQDLVTYTGKLLELAQGFSLNASTFHPEEYILDASMEELYRVIALGITGFDSPAAKLSLPEAQASLRSIQSILKLYQDENVSPINPDHVKAMHYLDKAADYLKSHTDFDAFNRMEFIIRFMNPACIHLGKTIAALGLKNNPAKYYLIEKSSHLFDAASLKTDIYSGDGKISAAKIELGKKLFFDPLLSANGKRSCAGCHQPQLSFTDGLPKAMQLDEHGSLPRNTPTLWNAALQRNLFYDSRQVSLDYLITEVLSNEKEMNAGVDKAVVKLHHEYKDLYRKAYTNSDSTLSAENIVNAISMYLRTLISYNSRFDQYIRGDKTKMTSSEVRGFNLFAGKARCGTCHFIPFFNGSKPPSYYYQESEVIGVPATTDTVRPELDSDLGRYQATKTAFHQFSFKTPTLRNIELTGPYMHNGVFKTLEEVIDFYNRGGGTGLNIAPEAQTLAPDLLNLTENEKTDLRNFLRTLSDTSGTTIAPLP